MHSGRNCQLCGHPILIEGFRSNSNAFKWTWTLSNGLKRFGMNSNAFDQMLSIQCFQSNAFDRMLWSNLNTFKWTRKLSNEFKRFQMNSNAFKWTQTLSNELKRFQMNSNAFKWTWTLSNELERFQMNSNPFEWTQKLSIELEGFRYILDVCTTGSFFHLWKSVESAVLGWKVTSKV